MNVILHVVRDTTLPDALGDTRTGSFIERAATLDVAVENGSGRIGEIRLHPSVALLLQDSRDTGPGATSPCRTGEPINLALRLLPDFRPRGLDVGTPIGRIVKLVRPDCILETLRVTLRLPIIIVGIIESDGRYRIDFRAQHAKEINFFLGLRVGHVNHALVPPRPTDVSQTYSRIARRPFHHRTARLDQSPLLSVLDDEQSGPVLDRTTRVHKLCLAQDIAASLLRQTRDANQWRVAYSPRESLDRRGILGRHRGGISPRHHTERRT